METTLDGFRLILFGKNWFYCTYQGHGVIFGGMAIMWWKETFSSIECVLLFFMILSSFPKETPGFGAARKRKESWCWKEIELENQTYILNFNCRLVKYYFRHIIYLKFKAFSRLKNIFKTKLKSNTLSILSLNLHWILNSQVQKGDDSFFVYCVECEWNCCVERESTIF